MDTSIYKLWDFRLFDGFRGFLCNFGKDFLRGGIRVNPNRNDYSLLLYFSRFDILNFYELHFETFEAIRYIF